MNSNNNNIYYQEEDLIISSSAIIYGTERIPIKSIKKLDVSFNEKKSVSHGNGECTNYYDLRIKFGLFRKEYWIFGAHEIRNINEAAMYLLKNPEIVGCGSSSARETLEMVLKLPIDYDADSLIELPQVDSIAIFCINQKIINYQKLESIIKAFKTAMACY